MTNGGDADDLPYQDEGFRHWPPCNGGTTEQDDGRKTDEDVEAPAREAHDGPNLMLQGKPMQYQVHGETQGMPGIVERPVVSWITVRDVV